MHNSLNNLPHKSDLMCLECIQIREKGAVRDCKEDIKHALNCCNERCQKKFLGVDGSQRGENSQQCLNKKRKNENYHI